MAARIDHIQTTEFKSHGTVYKKKYVDSECLRHNKPIFVSFKN